MKKELEDFVKEEVPRDLRAQILKGVEPILEEHRSRNTVQEEGFFAWLLRPAGWGIGLAGAGALALAITLFQNAKEPDGKNLGPLFYEAEMLKNADLLLHLEELEKWEKLKSGSKVEWHKKKS